MEKNKNYIYGLDGLKAIAILGVTFFHLFPSFVVGGYLGVSLFFVITGFLLATSSKHHFSIKTYYLKRIKRIYPSLLIVVLATCGIYFLLDPNLLSGMKMEVLSVFGGFNNWWQIFQNADYFTRISNASPFTHLWFLGIELQYYLIWPLLFIVYKKENKVPKLFYILIVVSMALMPILYLFKVDITRLYYGTDTRIYALLIGAVLGMIYKNHKYNTFTKVLAWITSILILIITGFSYFLIDGQSAFLYCGGMILMTLLFSILVFLVADYGFGIGKILDFAPLKWLGKHSFGIYLWQYPVIFLFQYLKLTKILFYFVLEILLILLLTIVLDTIIDFKNSNKVLLILLCIVTCIAMGFGGYGLVTSTDQKNEDLKQLEEQLEENTKKIEDNKEKDEVVVDETNHLENVVLVGDSVLLAASVEVMDVLPNCSIDAVVSRHLGEEQQPLRDFQAQGKLKDTVVIAMGTNGKIYDFLAIETMDMLKGKDVFWVNCYCPYTDWQDTNNEYLLELCKLYPNLHIIDWYTLANEHPEYLVSDGIHPSDEGCIAYANMIRDSIQSVKKNKK